MTREEAAEVLELMCGDWDPLDVDAWQALRMGAAALRGSQPDPITGLVPCGCGGKAILFHQPDIEGPGSDGDRWAVFCEKTCGMGTSDFTSREYAVETWNTGMGYTPPGAIGLEPDRTAPNGDKGATHG